MRAFLLLSVPQEAAARAIGARLAHECVMAGRFPAGVDNLDLLDRCNLFGGDGFAPPETILQAIHAADAGFFEALDETIQARPNMAPPAIGPDSGADDDQINLDFSGLRTVPRRWRDGMDEWLLILLDDAAPRHKWTASQFCAAYAWLAGPEAAGRLFIDPPLARAA